MLEITMGWHLFVFIQSISHNLLGIMCIFKNCLCGTTACDVFSSLTQTIILNIYDDVIVIMTMMVMMVMLRTTPRTRKAVALLSELRIRIQDARLR